MFNIVISIGLAEGCFVLCCIGVVAYHRVAVMRQARLHQHCKDKKNIRNTIPLRKHFFRFYLPSATFPCNVLCLCELCGCRWVADGCRWNAYLQPHLQPRNVHVTNGLWGYFGGGCRVADKNENNVFCTCDSMGDIKRCLLWWWFRQENMLIF